MKKLSINTGEPRNVLGHIISGAIAGAVVSSAINYKKTKSKELGKKDAFKKTMKATAQGAIATGSAIAAANYIGQGGCFKAISAVAVGVAGIYALEVAQEKCEAQYLTNQMES